MRKIVTAACLVILVVFAPSSTFSGESFRFDRLMRLGGALAREPATFPWLPDPVLTKKDRDARQTELRRAYLRKALVERYFAAVPAASHPEGKMDAIADEVADFIVKVETPLSSGTLDFNKRVLENIDAEPVVRLMALRIGKQNAESDVTPEKAEQSEQAEPKEPDQTVASEREKEAEKRFEQERLDLCREILAVSSEPVVRWYAAKVAVYITSWAGALKDEGAYKEFVRILYDAFIGCINEIHVEEPDLFLVTEWLRSSIYVNIDFRSDPGNVFSTTYLLSLLDRQPKAFQDKYAAFIGNLKGQFALDEAWKARGDGWASEVEPEQWKKVREKTAEAEKYFMAVDEAAPHTLPVAVRMIDLSMLKSGDVRYWFSRGAAICFDYMPLYTKILWAIRPRWGGSHAEMLVFGRQCLNSRRFDTLVPNVFTNAVHDVASETGAHWRAMIRLKPIKTALVELYEGYIAEPEFASLRNEWLASYAYAMFVCGEYAEARRLYDLVHPETLEKRSYDRYWLWSEAGFALLPKAVDMFLDERGETLRAAEDAEIKGDLAKAAALFIESFASFPDDPEAEQYIRIRLGECLFWRDFEPESVPFRASSWERLFQLSGGLETAATLAGDRNLPDVLAELFENGLDANAADPNGYPLLYYAIRGKSSECVTMLAKRGADVNARPGGLPLVLFAVEKNDPDIVNALLEKGASLDAVSEDGRTALYIAAMNNSLKIMPLLDGVELDPNVNLSRSFPPLYNAVVNGFYDMAKELLARGANPDLPYKNGYTPLHIAANDGKADMVELLLKNGAAVDSTLESGTTPLGRACMWQRLPAAELLLRNGANPSVLLYNGSAPLVSAAIAYKNDALVELLLQHGASVEQEDANGMSPLLTAIYHKNKNAVDMLLKVGADVNRAATAMHSSPLHLVAEDGDVDIATRVLDADPALDPRDKNGRTPLLLAARWGRADVARMFVERGADVLVWDPDWRLPSQLARIGHHDELAGFLLRAQIVRAATLALPCMAVLALLAVVVRRRRGKKSSAPVEEPKPPAA